jgi:methionine--tRNA ligase beta chain
MPPTDNNPAPLDLHAEVPLSDLKLEVSQGTKEAYEKAYANLPARTPEPQLQESTLITFDEFLKIDLRIGTVKTAERVPKSDKLLKLQVSFSGMGERQILAGVGTTFQPEALVGKQYLFVVNLPPRKMMGLESHVMLLATGSSEGLILVTPSSSAPDGSRLG